MNNRIVKIFVLLIFILVTFMLSLNYYRYNEIKINKVLDVDSYNIYDFKDNSENLKKTDELISFTDPNGVGTVTSSYSVTYDRINEFVNNVTYKGNGSIEYTFEFFLRDDSRQVIQSTDFIEIENNVKTYDLNQYVKKIVIKANYDIYGVKDKTTEYSDLLTIKNLNINSANSAKRFEKSILFNSVLTTLIITFLILIIYFLQYVKSEKFDTVKIPKLFLIFAIAYGFVFSILMPLYQVPDEMTHINMIYKEMGYKDIDFNKKIHNYADASSVVRNLNKRISSKEYFDLGKRINIKPELHVPSFKLIRHLPQAIGLTISMVLNLPIFITITLCELLIIVTYSLVCYKALELMPIKKHLLALLMLLPISIQQYTSFSYDAMLNCLCFLLIAYILNIKFKKKEFNLKDLLIVLLISLLIAIVKIPYVLLALLVLLIPLKKYNIDLKILKIDKKFVDKNKWRIIISLIVIVPLFGLLAYKILSKILIGRVLLSSIRYPRTTYYLLKETTKRHFSGYVNELFGGLGWFDIVFSKWFVIMTIIILLVTSFYKESKVRGVKSNFKIFDIVLMMGLFVAMYCLISISLLGWTLDAYGLDYSNFALHDFRHYMSIIPVIGGIQGRYFLPILPLILIPITSEKISNILHKHKFNIIYLVYFIIAAIYCSYVLIIRFWI